MFRFRRETKSALLFEQHGGTWEPQAHFTGDSTDPFELRAVQDVIDRHRYGLVAYHLCCPLPGFYSLELQWDADDEAFKAIEEYQSLFNDRCKLKVKPELGMLAIAVKPALPPVLVGLRDGEWEEWVRSMELIPYPAQYRRKGLAVCGDGNGIYKPHAYNRWGIVGDFLVLRLSVDGKWLNLTERQVEEVMVDLADAEGGYLSDDCPTLCLFREPFKQHGVPPSGAVPREGRWFG
jgi:hypothetical protein